MLTITLSFFVPKDASNAILLLFVHLAKVDIFCLKASVQKRAKKGTLEIH